MKPYLYISANGFIGGAERVVLKLCEIHQKNHEPCSVICFKNGPLVEALKAQGIPILVLQNQFKLTRPIPLIKALRELRKCINELNPSLIHTTMAYSHLVTGLATLFQKRPKVWFQHGPVGGKLDFLASFFENKMILFNSSFLMKKHQQSLLFPLFQRRLEILPLPVTLGEETPKRKEAFIIGSIARLTKEKGQDIIIEAFIKANLPQAQLLIIGEATTDKDRSFETDLKKMAIAHANISFLGHQQNPQEYYQKMSLFIHAGKLDEGFGLAVAEAMASKVCVISSPYGGLADLAIEEKTAKIFFPRSHDGVEQLSNLINQLYNDQETRERLAEQAFQLIKSNYSEKSTSNKLQKYYQNILNAQPN